MKIKMNISYIIIFFLLLNSVAYAGFTIYTGGSISAVQPGFENYKIGEVFGIQKHWGAQNWSLSSGLILNAKGGILKDKNFAFVNSTSGYHLDIHVSVDYLEIPLFLKIYKPINKNAKVGLCIGPSLAIGICDNTESKNATYFTFENSETTDKIKIDYWENYEGGSATSVVCLNTGFIFKLSEFFFEIRYCRALTDVNSVANKIINERFHSFNFLIGVEIFK